MYGGFNGSETLREQRIANPATNGTILSGDINAPGGMSDNAYNVVTAYNLGSSAVLDGFTITNGNANGALSDQFGGGMYIEDASPALRNLLIANNQAFRGGGMFITSNTSLASSPSLSDVGFAGNSASIGGGIFSQNSAPLLSRVVFSGNSATAGAGGGMNVQTISDLDPPVYTSLTDVIFKNNTATGGGGLFLGNTSSATTITNATFDGNVANRRGGAMLFEYSSPTLTNVTVANNISNDNLASPKGGGGIMNIDSSPTLIHVTFSGNNSLLTGGDAMRNAAGLDLTGSFPLIRNSILWDSDDEITTEDLGGATISDSILKGGCPAGSTCSNVTGADPLLGLLANNGGFGETLAIGLGSPANNSASLASCTPFDQRGVSRPQGSGCDLGAFELVETGLPTPTPTNTPLPPTATPTSTPLPPTATPTSMTSVPPTDTATSTPTGTSTATQTNTALPPTATSTSTPTFTPTATSLVCGVLHVDNDSSVGSPDGCTWGTAFRNLQDALAGASSGDEIWVAAGTYYPDQGTGRHPAAGQPPSGWSMASPSMAASTAARHCARSATPTP